MHWPSASYFQPWYGQRMPFSSLRPNHSDTPRCAQNSSIRPILPEVSRNASRRSDRILMRTGGQSGSGSSTEVRIGCQ